MRDAAVALLTNLDQRFDQHRRPKWLACKAFNGFSLTCGVSLPLRHLSAKCLLVDSVFLTCLLYSLHYPRLLVACNERQLAQACRFAREHRARSVADPAPVAAMFTEVETELGPVSILVNNAGIYTPATLESNDATARETGVP